MGREIADILQRAILLGLCALTLFTFATGLCACAMSTAQGPTVQLDPDVDDRLGGTGIESGDIRGASEQIARAVIGFRKGSPEAPRITLMPVINHTRFRVDPALLKNRLLHNLVSGARGRFAVVETSGDLLLKTELRSLTKDNGEITSDYVQYAFTLERPTDGAVVWTGIYETKRMSEIDVIYQ